MNLKRIAINTTFLLFIAKSFGLILNLITLIIVAKLLGPSEYGIYTIAFTYFLLVDLIGNAGLGTFAQRELSTRRRDKSDIIATSLAIAILIGFILFIIGSIIGYFIYSKENIDYSLLLVSSIIVITAILYGVPYHALVGLRLANKTMLSSIVKDTTVLIFSIILLKIGLGPYGALSALLIGYIFGSMIGIYYLIKKIGIGRVNKNVAKEAISFSTPIAINNAVSSSLSNIIVMVLGIYFSQYLVGNYGIMLRVFSIITLIYGTINLSMLTIYTYGIKRIAKLFERSFFISLSTILIILFYIGANAKALIFFFIGSKYAIAPYFVLIGSILLSFGIPSILISPIFFSLKRQKAILKINSISYIISIFVFFVLLPIIGIYSGIVSFLFVYNIVNNFTYFKTIGIKVNKKKIIRIYGIGFTFMLIFYIL